jgi:hypothetical protein
MSNYMMNNTYLRPGRVSILNLAGSTTGLTAGFGTTTGLAATGLVTAGLVGTTGLAATGFVVVGFETAGLAGTGLATDLVRDFGLAGFDVTGFEVIGLVVVFCMAGGLGGPSGCLVSTSLDTAWTIALRSGTAPADLRSVLGCTTSFLVAILGTIGPALVTKLLGGISLKR